MQLHADIARGGGQSRHRFADHRDDLRRVGFELAAQDLLADRDREQCELLLHLGIELGERPRQ